MEYELKFKLGDKKGFISRLIGLGAIDLGRRKETDIFIGQVDRGLRLRKFGRDGLVTLKQIVVSKARAKVRREIETKVTDIDSLIEMFKVIGFPETKRREKIRHTFKLRDALVLIDKLPFMGYFVEIEAASAPVLTRAAKRLGFDPAKGICDSYDNMFFAHFLVNAAKYKRSATPILPTFQSERQFKQGLTG